MTSMKKEEARRAVLSEYDRWAKKHPNKASMMGGFLFFRYLHLGLRRASAATRSLFANVKNNVSRKMSTLSYRIVEKSLPGGTGSVHCRVWCVGAHKRVP
jgi:hypothetical protein